MTSITVKSSSWTNIAYGPFTGLASGGSVMFKAARRRPGSNETGPPTISGKYFSTDSKLMVYAKAVSDNGSSSVILFDKNSTSLERISGPIESYAARIKRLATSARNNNPVENPPLTGGKPWLVLTGAWAPSSAVVQGQLRSNGGRAYLCIRGGTTASSGGPTGTAAGVNLPDNTAAWVYYTGVVGDRVSNGGNVYEITVAGLPSSTPGGPTGLGIAIVDGTITWAFLTK